MTVREWLYKGNLTETGFDKTFANDPSDILCVMQKMAEYDDRTKKTAKSSIHKNAELLKAVRRGLLRNKFVSVLRSPHILSLMLEFPDVFTAIVPEMADCVGHEQDNPYHMYNVYDHIAHAVGGYKGTDERVLIALVLHDIGKPSCHVHNETGGHFYGHAKVSAEMAETIVRDFGFKEDDAKTIISLIAFHDCELAPTKKSIGRMMSKYGDEFLFMLMDVRAADANAHSDYRREERESLQKERIAVINQIIYEREHPEFTRKDLAINGNDIIDELCLVPGRETGKIIGSILESLVESVREGRADNDRETLLRLARGLNK